MVLFAFRGLFLPQLKASLNMLTEPPILAFLNFQVNFPDPFNLQFFMPAKLVQCIGHCQILTAVQNVILPVRNIAALASV